MAWWLVVWIAGTLAVVAWGLIGWASTWWMGCNAQRVTDPTWVEAAREAAERLRNPPGCDPASGRAGGDAADLGSSAAGAASPSGSRRVAL